MKQAVVALLALWLASCSHAPVISEQVPTAGIDAWKMSGRIAIARQNEGFNGRFVWDEQPSGMQLRVRGPLGFGGIEINGHEGAYTVIHSGEHFQTNDPETELSALVGWWLPVHSLSAWLRAVPDERFPFQADRDSDGRLVSLMQRGWSAEYPSYRQRAEYLLPYRILLDNGEVRVRVVVDRFEAKTN